MVGQAVETYPSSKLLSTLSQWPTRCPWQARKQNMMSAIAPCPPVIHSSWYSEACCIRIDLMRKPFACILNTSLYTCPTVMEEGMDSQSTISAHVFFSFGLLTLYNFSSLDLLVRYFFSKQFCALLQMLDWHLEQASGGALMLPFGSLMCLPRFSKATVSCSPRLWASNNIYQQPFPPSANVSTAFPNVLEPSFLVCFPPPAPMSTALKGIMPSSNNLIRFPFCCRYRDFRKK